MEQQANTMKKPLDYIKLLFHRKWLIIIPTVLGLIGGLVAGNIMPKQYESSTLILVEEGRVINPLIKDLAVSTSVAARLNILREQILGWDRINQLISTLDLAKEVRSQKEYEGLVKKLRSNIDVTHFRNNIIRISYTGKDPQEAMNIVKTITDIFIAENLRQQTAETDNAIAFINDQLELYSQRVKQSEIATMEDELRNLLIDSTDRHPMVIDLRARIDAARAELERGDFTLGDTIRTQNQDEMDALRSELQELRQEIAVGSTAVGGANRTVVSEATNDKLYRLLLLERVERATPRTDAGVNQALYNELLKRLETAKITQQLEASKDGTRYTILDPARLPLTPSKPNKPMLLLLGIFGGFGGGICLVFLMEMLDRSFLGVDEAREHLGLELLGAIPSIVTSIDIRARKIRKIKIVLMSLMTSTAIAVFMIYSLIIKG